MDYTKLWIAFYRGGDSWYHRLIRWWTNSVHSHVELVVPGDMRLGITPFEKSCVSIRPPPDDPDSWDLLEIDVTPEQLAAVWLFFCETEGDDYDWVGLVLSHVTPLSIRHGKRWFCSRWIATALAVAGVVSVGEIGIHDSIDMSPQRLWERLTSIVDSRTAN